MNEDSIVDNWRQLKFLGRNFRHLEKPLLVEHEYRHRFGHPSSYAYVQFECEPAETLTFESTATWSESLSSGYVDALKRAVCEGIVDGLIATSIYPYRGCSLTLCQIKWDDVGSSESAFYLATKSAMAQLIESGSWKVKSKTKLLTKAW